MGLTIGLNIFEGAFWAMGSGGGPIGNFIASFASGMLSAWASGGSPVDLNTTFSNLVIRLQQTSFAVQSQLQDYSANVPQYWNTTFTVNGQTATLSDLATLTMPSESDPQFNVLAGAAIVGLDQQIWTYVLQADYMVTKWTISPTVPYIVNGKEDTPPVAYVESYIAQNPASYFTWVWQQGGGCGGATGWLMTLYSIGLQDSNGTIPAGACAYLFQDSAPGVIINSEGLFPRATVFSAMGIEQVSKVVAVPSVGDAVSDKLSAGYLRAMTQGKTLGRLIESEGRAAVEQRIIAKAQADEVFATRLQIDPRNTLADFLGVQIPDIVNIRVTVENPNTFGLVVPMKGA